MMSKRKQNTAQPSSFYRVVLTGLAAGAAMANVCAPAAFAGPQGEQVVAGQVNITRDGAATVIQASNNAIINYQSFNIASHEAVQFIQPSADARVLNRVMDGRQTQIDGTLQANGHVYIVNPAGVFFGNTALVNVGALTAAAGTITDQHFLGNIDFYTDMAGSVHNNGQIEARSVSLVGAQVANYGRIVAPQGMVTLAAGKDVYLAKQGSSVVVRLEGGNAEQPGAAVTNAGDIDADGGAVFLGAADVYALPAHQSGNIKASNVTIEGNGGAVLVGGHIDASNNAGKGGSIHVTGKLTYIGDNAVLDASGTTGGGEILVGGDLQGRGPLTNSKQTYVARGTTLRADATVSGDGGKVIVWADDDTRYFGSISAKGGPQGGNGGFAEVSGGHLKFEGPVDLSSALGGTAGTLLLDPDAIEIRGGTGDGSDVNSVFYDSATTLLSDGGFLVDVVLFSDVGDGSEPFIVYESELEREWGSIGAYGLEARRSISVTGTFSDNNGDGVVDVLISNNFSLYLVTSNEGAADTGSINLTGSSHGSALAFQTQGTGSLYIYAGRLPTFIYGADFQPVVGAAAANIITGRLITASGDVTIAATNGNVTVNGTIASTSGDMNVDASGAAAINSLVNITGQLTVDANSITVGNSVVADAIDLTATSSVTLDATGSVATTGGAIDVNAGALITVSKALASNGGNVTLAAGTGLSINSQITSTGGNVTASTAAGDLLLNTLAISAGSGTVTVAANAGNITTNSSAASEIVTTGDVILTGRGIGATNSLDLQSVTSLTVTDVSGGNGIIRVDELVVSSIQDIAIIRQGTGLGSITIDFAGNDSISITDAGGHTLAGIELNDITRNFAFTANGGNIVDTAVTTVSGTFTITNLHETGTTTLDQLAVTGALAVFAEDNVTLVNTLGINFTNSAVDGNLTATATTGNITDTVVGGGSIAVTGNASFTTSATNATITLDALAVTGSVAANTTGANAHAVLADTGGMTLGASTIGGNLTATALGGILDDSGIVTVNGNASLVAASGDIETNQLAVVGTIALETNNNAIVVNASAINFAASTVFGNLEATATTGGITDAGALTVSGTASFTTSAAGADIALDLLDVTGAIALATTGANGDATIVNANSLTLDTSTVNGNLAAAATTGNITDTNTVTVTGTAAFTTSASGADITLDSLAVTGAISASGNGAGSNVTITDTTGFTIGVVSTGGNVALTATTGDILLGDNAVSGADVTLTASAGDIDVANATVVEEVTATGSVALIARGIGVTNPLDVRGATALAITDLAGSAADIDVREVNASTIAALTITQQDVQIGDIAIDFFGDDALSILEDVVGDHNLDAIELNDITRHLTFNAEGGNIIDSGTITVSGNAVFTSAVANASIDLGSLAVAGTVAVSTVGASGDAILVNSTALTLANSTIGGNLDATAATGNLTDSGVLTVAGDASFTTSAANADILVDQLAAAGSVTLATNGVTGNATVVNTTAIDLDNVVVGGDLSVTATTGNITDTSATTVGGNASFTTSAGGADILLSDLDITGTVALSTNGAGAHATVTDASNLVLAASTIGGNLIATSTTSDLADSGIITVGGTASFTTSQANANIIVNQLAVTSTVSVNTAGTGDATVVNATALTLAASSVGDDLIATATTGNLTDQGAIVVGGDATLTTAAAGADILADQLNVAGDLVVNTNGADANATIVNAVGITLDSSTIGGALALTATTGDITNIGALVVGNGATFTVNTADQLFDNTAGAITNNGLAASSIAVVADNIDLAGGTIAGGVGSVSLQGRTAGRLIDLGTKVAAVNTLELLLTDLNTIATTGVLRIGSAGAGNLAISSNIAGLTPTTLHLTTGGSVTGTAAGIAIANLAVSAGGTVLLDHASTAISTLAVNSTAGDVEVVNNQSLIIGSVDGVTGITAAAGLIDIEAANGGTLTINQAVTGFNAIDLLADDDVIFAAAGDVTGTGVGDITVTADNDGSGGGTGGAITMADGSIIMANTGSVILSADESVTLGSVRTSSGLPNAIQITSASGGIVDGGDTDIDVFVPAGGLVMSAATGIGVGNALETTVASVDATVTGAGDIALNETNAIALTSIITADGAFTLTAGGAVTAVAVDTSNVSDGTNGVTLTTTSGNITVQSLVAGGDASLDAAGAINGSTDDNTADLVGDVLTLVARSGGIGTTTVLDVTANDHLDARTTDNSDILIDSIGDLVIGLVDAGSGPSGGAVTLDSTGAIDAITDDVVADIRGSDVSLTAASIGTSVIPNILAATSFTADTSASNGDINISFLAGQPTSVINAGTGAITIDVKIVANVASGLGSAPSDPASLLTDALRNEVPAGQLLPVGEPVPFTPLGQLPMIGGLPAAQFSEVLLKTLDSFEQRGPGSLFDRGVLDPAAFATYLRNGRRGDSSMQNLTRMICLDGLQEIGRNIEMLGISGLSGYESRINGLKAIAPQGMDVAQLDTVIKLLMQQDGMGTSPMASGQ